VGRDRRRNLSAIRAHSIVSGQVIYHWIHLRIGDGRAELLLHFLDGTLPECARHRRLHGHILDRMTNQTLAIGNLHAGILLEGRCLGR
jgi:hypothetical protein